MGCSGVKVEENTRIQNKGKKVVDETKYILNFHLVQRTGIKILNPNIQLEVIHVESIDSTMPASRQYIDGGNKLPFIYNTEIQTAGKGKGNRKWAGSIKGNLYTSVGIPLSFIKNELNNNDIIVRITAISIMEELNRYTKDQYFLKYPNDIICKDKNKIGGIIAEEYKDFYIIGFGLNVIEKPDKSSIRVSGLDPCCIKEHFPKNCELPTALEFSEEITKNILYNLNLSSEKVNEKYNGFLKNVE
jgi:BirA family biotin operon repressor/biotin-[acetyl-CoA-carboxylase] ligase